MIKEKGSQSTAAKYARTTTGFKSHLINLTELIKLTITEYCAT